MRPAEVAVFVSQYSVMLSRILSRVRPPVGCSSREGARDLLEAVRVVVDDPARQTDGRIGQAVADRLRPRALLSDVTPLELRAVRIERRPLALRHPLRGRRKPVERGEHVGRGPPEEVEVDAEQSVRRHEAQSVGDGGADVAALGHIARVAEAIHQRRPGLRDAARIPADGLRLGREPVAGQRRQHEVEGILGASAVRGRIGERADDLKQLEDRAGPPVGDDQRQRVLVRRPDMDEVDVEAVDLGLELR
jgi:hypothetical protein